MNKKQSTLRAEKAQRYLRRRGHIQDAKEVNGNLSLRGLRSVDVSSRKLVLDRMCRGRDALWIYLSGYKVDDIYN